ncbi:pitrilysin family protein [uncultured Albimonas sp.]|uniref:M16 family metallopeptidase n=1 Tax=uncultured Albimonas sp. TaxID=1331701 RepID=UPI0030EE30F6|tara:strand:+ start:182 stop:1636 length:1455 start_codon:yes stop_codon:yes gene_type:complete
MILPAPRPALAVLAAAAALAASLAAPAAAEPPVTTFELENGLRAVVIEDHRAPVVTHMVWYRIGAADEPPGKSGIAHFLEHLMFKSTDEIPDAAFSKIVAANGGQDNAFTSRDYTGYFQRIAADRLGLVMKMEADRMRDLELTEDQVTPERQVILEERSSRTDTNPQAIFGEQRDAALYMNHPYGIPVIGWRAEMEGLTRQDALDFYRTYYAPNNAILVVAGDVTPEQVEALAQEHFGPLAPTQDLPERTRPMEPPQLAERRMVYEDARIGQPYLMREYLTIARRDDAARAAALQVLADVLGDGINSRFTQALVVGGGVALQAGAWYSGDWRDYGEFGVYAVPAPGRSLQEAEDAMDAALAEFVASEGPTEAELERIKMGYRSAEVYRQDSQMALAREYGSALAADYTLEQIREWPERLQAVSAGDVMEAARQVLDRRRSVTGWLRQPSGSGTEAEAGAGTETGAGAGADTDTGTAAETQEQQG